MKASSAFIVGLTVLIAGCDSPRQEQQAEPVSNAPTDEPVQQANETAEAPAEGAETADAPQPAAGKSSIIRPSVLAETEAPPVPQVQPVDVVIPLADAAGSLPDGAARLLDELLERPAVAAGGCILIRGHTDARGSDQQNLRASERRAELVRDYLVERRIDPARIRLIALGERRPLAPNALPDGSDYPEGRAKNRRVDVRVELPEAQRSCATGEQAVAVEPS